MGPTESKVESERYLRYVEDDIKALRISARTPYEERVSATLAHLYEFIMDTREREAF